MRKFDIQGMSCAACSARVERAVGSLDGVRSCSVNLLTNSMSVDSDLSDKTIISAVENAGYGASVSNDASSASAISEHAKNETKNLISRLILSCVVLIFLMYVSMGHVMWGFPMPEFFGKNPVAIALVQLVLSAAVMLINKRFFISGIKGALNRSPNMDTLVSLGSGAAFIYSACMTVKMATVDADMAHHILHSELYFESAAMILALITVGKMLEARAKGRTTSAIEALINLAPKIAHKIDVNGNVVDIPASEIKVGDRFCVFAGESVPTDAKIIDGGASLDESMLTGESLPVDKAIGDSVFGATVSRSGYIVCEAENVGEGTVLSGIIKMVSDATATKAPIAKIADKVSAVFVPCVLGISFVTTVVWLIVSGMDIGFSLARGISVLVISCPCALGLATPVAIMVGSGVGAKKGILFKNATALENMGRADIVILDKTGTITRGKPTLTDIVTADGIDENELLAVAISLESKSEHPLAEAIVEYCKEKGITEREISDFKTLSGNGVEGLLDGDLVLGSSVKFAMTRTEISDGLKDAADRLSEEGKTPMVFARGKNALGIIAVADELRADSQSGIAELRRMGLFTVMLTGDNSRTARAIGKRCGVDYIVSDVLPAEKGEIVEDMKKFGSVIMVGDGINDAVALTVSDVGVAIGAGSHIAVDAASVVLINSGVSSVGRAICLSRKTLLNIKENLLWAFGYNVIGIPLAAGVFSSLLGWSLSPMFGALAMSLSSFAVVTNALRLNLVRLDRPKRTKAKSHVDIYDIEKYFIEKEEKKKMEITIKVSGMMCPHCEARVKKSLEANENIASAIVSHIDGTAIVTTSGDISVEQIKSIIIDAGYDVL